MNTLWYVSKCAAANDNMADDYESGVSMTVKNGEESESETVWRGPKKAWLKLTSKFYMF